MAGQGPAPKPSEQRRTRHVPQRGDWVDLPARNDAPVPPLPDRDEPWKSRTRMAWDAWWRDPAATQWTSADIDNVLYLAELMDLGTTSIANEMRLRMDGLGLTQKGKRDMRWRVVADGEPAVVEKPKASAQRRSRLKVV